jgi:hypothetical protein
LEYGREFHAIFFTFVDDLITALECDFERLFDNDMLPRAGGRDGGFHVSTAGGGDRDGIDLVVGEQAIERIVRLAVEFFSEGVGFGGRAVVACD